MTNLDLPKDPKSSTRALKAPETPDEINTVINGVGARINQVLDSGDIEELKKVVLTVADYVDESSAMQKIRMIWSHVPGFVRWAIINKPSAVLPDPFTETAKNLILCGLLPYTDDPGMNEEYLKHKDNYDKEYLKWAIKLGKFIVPELAVIDKYMGTINKVLDAQADFRIMIRHHLANKPRGGVAPEVVPGGGDSGEGTGNEPPMETDYIRENPDLLDEDMIHPGPTYNRFSAQSGKKPGKKELTDYISEEE